MGYELSFSNEFYFAPDETERAPAVNADGKPISLYGAIMAMPRLAFYKACRKAGIYHRSHDAAVELTNYARQEVNHCRNINSPVEVSVTKGDWPITVLVYDGPEVEPAAGNVPNLDAMTHDALMAFWKRYHRASRRDAEDLVGDRRKGFTNIAADLANYACNKAVAMTCRLEGKVDTALGYERQADIIHSRLPFDLRW